MQAFLRLESGLMTYLNKMVDFIFPITVFAIAFIAVTMFLFS